MSVPENRIVGNHFQGRLENRPISLRLRKIDIKAVVGIPDAAIGFVYTDPFSAFPLTPTPFTCFLEPIPYSSGHFFVPACFFPKQINPLELNFDIFKGRI
jgi:hypothetical protein